MNVEPAAAGTDRDEYRQELSRSLSLRGNILITLSAVTPASSVFIIVPAVLAAIGGASFIAFAIAAVVGIFMAYCYAELSSAYPIAGGEYSFAARVLGKATGFALFLMNAMTLVLIIGVIALGTGQYLAAAFSGADSKWAGVVVIVVCAIIAVLNIRTNAWVTGTFLVLEMLALIVLVVLGLAHVSRGVGTLFDAQTIGAHQTLVGVGMGVVFAQTATTIFAYNGYGAAVYFSEETRGNSRHLARAIMVSLAVTVAAELIPTVCVLLGAPSLTKLLSNPAPMQYFVTARGSSGLNTAVSLGIAIAIINATVAITLQAGRTLYGSARDRAYPDAISKFFGYVHPRLQTPLTATLFVGAAAAIVASFVPLNALIIATGATLIFLYALVALSAIVGRLNGKTKDAPYKMPAWPIAPALVIVALAYVAYQVWKIDWRQIVVALGALAAGYVYYYAYLHPRRATRWTMPMPARDTSDPEAAGGLLTGPALEMPGAVAAAEEV